MRIPLFEIAPCIRLYNKNRTSVCSRSTTVVEKVEWQISHAIDMLGQRHCLGVSRGLTCTQESQLVHFAFDFHTKALTLRCWTVYAWLADISKPDRYQNPSSPHLPKQCQPLLCQAPSPNAQYS